MRINIWRKRASILLSLILMAIGLACHPTAQIGHKVQRDKLVDGIYEASYKGGPNYAEVRVTIQDQKISHIEILKHETWKGKKAEPIIPQRIIEAQSTNVDAVTGATNSSNVIMNAVQRAVEESYAAQ